MADPVIEPVMRNRVHHRKRFVVERGGRRYVEGDSALVVFDAREVMIDWIKFGRGNHPQSEREFLGAVVEYEGMEVR